MVQTALVNFYYRLGALKSDLGFVNQNIILGEANILELGSDNKLKNGAGVDSKSLQIELSHDLPIIIKSNLKEKMQRHNLACIKQSFFDLGELDDPQYYKNQSFSLKFINSVCQLPSFNDFNDFGQKHNIHEEHRYEEPIADHKDKLEIDSYLEEADQNSDKQVKSIGSTKAHLCSNLTIAENNQQITASPTTKKGTGCNCKKTGCLKMYCECFSSGKVCTDQCNCCNCSNCDQQAQSVKKAKEIARNKHRFAFSPIDGSNRKHCNCRKTQCQKKYCECYNSGQSCNELCKCEDCLNGTHSPHEHEEGMQELVF